MDVTPRTTGAEPLSGPTRRRRNPLAWLVLLLVLAGIAFVMVKALDSAALYYRNADEAVADKDSLGTRRFRVQGQVGPDVVRLAATDEVDFTISFNDAAITVHHHGDPPELFKPGVPVVLEGRWQGDVFASDRILVKHSAEYREQNPDRVSNAPG